MKYSKIGVVLMILFSVLSCSKEKTEDDPTIKHTIFNQSVGYNFDNINSRSFDINDDGFDDVRISIDSRDEDPEEIEIEIEDAFTDYALFAFYADGGAKLAKSYAEGALIQTAGADFYSDIRIASNIPAKGEVQGKGDTYIGLKIKQSPVSLSYSFAWLRINISQDLKTVKIIDAGYQTTADTPIKAGAI